MMVDFKLICNVIHKIIMKTIANRLKSVLHDLIAANQSAFISGRLITDNVISTFELLQSLHKKNNRHIGFMMLKLDMSKAYGRMERAFLATIMEKMMGFSGRWVELVMECVSITHFSFCLNDQIRGDVVPTRGLRQGHPIFLYLFIMCLEAFSSLIKGAKIGGELVGLSYVKACPKLSRLFLQIKALFLLGKILKIQVV